MTTNAKKFNIASLRVLRTLLCLFHENLTMNDLIDRLNAYEDGFNNFIVSKYINTCKSCGIDIQKIENKYTLVNFPVGGKISNNEGKLLSEIKDMSSNLKTSYLEEQINSFINKMHFAMSKPSLGLTSSKNYRIIKYFEKAYKKRCDIQIIFNDKTTYCCSPISLSTVNGRVIFKTSNNKGKKEINPDDVLDIKMLENKSPETESTETVIFELYGDLAHRYQLRENEEWIKTKKSGTLVIQNNYEQKEQLLHRLMRYDSSCKILKPQSYIDAMKEMIEQTISNYE